MGTSSAPLFGPGGPKPSHVKQGSLGDCYLLAAFIALARKDPAAIERMISDNGDGTYTVSLHRPSLHVYGMSEDGHPTFKNVPGGITEVTVNGDVPYTKKVGGDPKYAAAAPASWPAILEKAFAEEYGGGAGYEGINGGATFGNKPFDLLGYPDVDVVRPADGFEALEHAVADHPVVAGTAADDSYVIARETFAIDRPPPNHAYAVVSTHRAADGTPMVDLVNPHSRPDKKYGAAFSLTYDEYGKWFDAALIGK